MIRDKILQLYGGRLINPKDLSLDDINIEAIAHSLSLQTRFSGHCKYHYSVAQHSLYVSQLCPNELKLCGLLHDATEFVLIDVPSFIKQEPEFHGYRLIEKYVWLVIAYKYNLPVQIPDIIKKIDKCVLYFEAETLMLNENNTLNEFWKDYAKYTYEFGTVEIIEMHPKDVEVLFLKVFYGLQKK